MIPEKGEHHVIEEEYEDVEHYIPEKTEHDSRDVHHLDKEDWTPEFHGDDITKDHLDNDPLITRLKPK